jgi:hypothetical protein
MALGKYISEALIIFPYDPHILTYYGSHTILNLNIQLTKPHVNIQLTTVGILEL